MNFRLVLSLSSICFLASCVPVLFTGAAATTVATAKSRTIGQTVDDVKIAGSIRADFIKNHFHDLYKKITVEVVAGRVLYLGKVEKEEDIHEAIKIAWAQNGVKEVVSELEVDEKSNYFDLVQYSKDTFITSQVKTRLFANRNIKFINYTIVTNNNVIYIFGLARSEEELEKVSEIAAKVRGVERVVEHVKIVEKQVAPEDFDEQS
jgi:osmotically-inducible protein OsmY